MTAETIRAKIIETVSHNGGHLASSLGAVEIAMALNKVFDAQKDRIIWDVGHQAYAWKILTGRAEQFNTLRKLDGLSGFPNPQESNCDASFSGHAGAALSTALGFAAARDQKGSDEHIIAVIGDSSMANGVSFEALNHCATATSKVIVVLNDNDMSIAKPSGSFAMMLGKLITGVKYNRVKMAAENAGHAIKLTFLRGIYHRLESRIKSLFLKNAYFEQFGLRYIGPIDGHNLEDLISALTVAKNDKRSVLLHVVTKKGKGFVPAEKDPTSWHGVGPFDVAAAEGQWLKDNKTLSAKSWSEVFGSTLCKLARNDNRIVALTAAMRDGTGLNDFAREFPKRFFDVGIAEEHMIAFAGGLAAAGVRPIVAVYSTFLQRAVDQVMHDVCLNNLPVVFCVDRAGVVGADGVTHQGVFDIAMLKCLPNITICQPKDETDFENLLKEALLRNGPTVIRYPRGNIVNVNSQEVAAMENPKFAIWATGDWFNKATEVAQRVNGVAVHARYIKPFDAQLLAEERARGMKIVSLENGSIMGGLGESIGADYRFGWPDEYISHGSQTELEKKYGLDVDSIVEVLNG